MAFSPYPTPAHPYFVELEVKRSKFLTYVCPCATTDAANAFIKSLRHDNPQANHVCWAYKVGSPDSTLRSMSDDGEPSGTAGMPMLKVLEHSGLGDIAVAVVRYFGGTKLGTGGLQRAYSDAVATALKSLVTVTKVDRVKIRASFDYCYQGAINNQIEALDCENTSFEYTEKALVTTYVAREQLALCQRRFTDICGGDIRFSISES